MKWSVSKTLRSCDQTSKVAPARSCPAPPHSFSHGSHFRGYEARLDQVPNLLGSLAQRGFRLDGPAHGHAHEDSLCHARQVNGRDVAPDFAALLGQQENLRQDSAADVETLHQFFTDGSARSVRRKNCAQQGGAFIGLADGVAYSSRNTSSTGPFVARACWSARSTAAVRWPPNSAKICSLVGK